MLSLTLRARVRTAPGRPPSRRRLDKVERPDDPSFAVEPAELPPSDECAPGGQQTAVSTGIGAQGADQTPPSMHARTAGAGIECTPTRAWSARDGTDTAVIGLANVSDDGEAAVRSDH
jgi:hypothetical protein